MSPSIAHDVRRAAEILDRSEKANDFLSYARVLIASRAFGRSMLDLAAEQRVSPRVIEVIKTSVAGIDTGTGAGLYPTMVSGFLESIRPISVFDRLMSGGMVRAPLRTKLVSVASGITGSTSPEGSIKPLGSLSLNDDALLEPKKVAAIVVATRELLKFSIAGGARLFDSELRTGVARATNAEFLSGLIAETTPTASAGGTAANIWTDLNTLLGGIDLHEGSRLYFIVTPDDAKALATKLTATNILAFPNFSATGGGEVLPGVTGLVSSDMPAGTALMIDASGIVAGDEGIALDGTWQTSLQMDTAPDSPPVAGTVMVSLFQENKVALRAERAFAFAPGRSGAVASLSGVNY